MPDVETRAMSVEELIDAMKALVEAATAEDRELTDEEADRYEELEGHLTTARRSQEIQRRQTAYEAPAVNFVRTAVRDGRDDQDRAFEHMLRTGQANSDLIEYRAQGEGVAQAGGYLVPPGFRQKLVERMVAFGGLAGEVETITTDSGNPLEFPTTDDTGNSGEIVAEHGTFAAGADITFGTETLNAYKYMAGGASNLPIRVSVELLQDSAFNVEDHLARAMGTRIARAQAAHWVTGTGVNQPEGITLPGQPVGTPAEAVDVNDVVDFDDLLDTMAQLDPAYMSNAKWAFNNATLFVLRGLLDGASRPLWLPQAESGLTNLPGGTLLGHPVVIDQAFPSNTADSARFAVFGDLREAYVIRRVKDVTVAVDPYTRMANGEVQYTAWARADGIVQNRNAYVILANITA